MAKRVSGAVMRKKLADGSTTYSIRFGHRGEKWVHRLGNSKDHWTEERVQAERQLLSTLIERGEYVRPVAAPPPIAAPSAAAPLPVAAAAFLARRRNELAPKSIVDLEWRLRHAVTFFGDVPLDTLTHARMEDFKVAKLQERQAIEEAKRAGKPLMERYLDKHGRTCRRRRRGLDKAQVNKVLAAIDRVLRDAVDRDELDEHPAPTSAGRLRMRISSKKRSFLELYQAVALLDAAREVEGERRGLTWEKVDLIRASSSVSAVALAKELKVSDVLIGKVRRGEIWNEKAGKRNRNDVPRLAPIVALLLLGVRIDECCQLNGGDVDFSRGVHVRTSKTDAGRDRLIPMLPLAHEVLLDHILSTPCGPTDPVFRTRNGKRQSPDNVRAILRPAVARANELLDERRLPPIVGCTPHALRRTFASLLAECAVPMPRAMQLLGHTNPKMTVGVYQQAMWSGDGAEEMFEKVTGASLDDALATFRQRSIRTPLGHLDENKVEGEVADDPR